MRSLTDDSGVMNLKNGNWTRFMVIYVNRPGREYFLRYDVTKHGDRIWIEKTKYNAEKSAIIVKQRGKIGMEYCKKEKRILYNRFIKQLKYIERRAILTNGDIAWIGKWIENYEKEIEELGKKAEGVSRDG